MVTRLEQTEEIERLNNSLVSAYAKIADLVDQIRMTFKDRRAAAKTAIKYQKALMAIKAIGDAHTDATQLWSGFTSEDAQRMDTIANEALKGDL